MGKPIKTRKPKIRITRKGIKLSRPSFRIGGKKAGVNVSSAGVSQSGKVAGVSYNTGNKKRRAGCSLLVLLPLAVPAILAIVEIAKGFT